MVFDDYIFREAKDATELLELLKLRYQVYRNSRLKGFVAENRAGIDLDEFDAYSKHYGLFGKQGNQETPIGYVRVIEEERNQLIDQLPFIMTPFPEAMNGHLSGKPILPFSTLSYFPGAKVLHQHLLASSEVKPRICEAGRFAIKKEFRSLSLSLFAIECLIGTLIYQQEVDYIMIACSNQHARIYKSYGLQQAPNTAGENIEEYEGPKALLLLLQKQNISESRSEKFKMMGCQFQGEQRISFLLHNPKKVWNRPVSSSNIIQPQTLVA